MPMKKIEISPLSADAFEPYGSVVTTPKSAPTAADQTFKFWSDVASYHIEGETEIGVCTVYGGPVDWMERHDRTPEILVPAGGAFILPVYSEEHGVRAFRVEPGEAVVIGSGVWHSACRPVQAEEATYLVIFRRGTPAEDVIKKGIEAVEVAAK